MVSQYYRLRFFRKDFRRSGAYSAPPAIQRSGWQAAMEIPREYTITAGRVHVRRKMAYGM